MKWADERMLSALSASAPESMLAPLKHIFQGEDVWLRRIPGEPGAQLSEIEVPGPEALRELWSPVHRDWLGWAGSLTSEADWARIVPHRNSRGDLFEMPAWQVMMHVVNHGSYHRGQVAMRLREAGMAPPPTDLIQYYRSAA